MSAELQYLHACLQAQERVHRQQKQFGQHACAANPLSCLRGLQELTNASAGILSSYGELQHMHKGGAELVPFDPFAKQPKMSYKDGFQRRYFVLDSFERWGAVSWLSSLRDLVMHSDGCMAGAVSPGMARLVWCPCERTLSYIHAGFRAAGMLPHRQTCEAAL